MRLGLLFLFFSFSALAQIDTGTGVDGACTQATIVNGGEFDCTTLTISASPVFNVAATSLIIKVQGSVTISAPLNLDGKNGSNQTPYSGTAKAGGDGGPGAGNGGGDNGSGLRFKGTDASTASGTAAATGNVTCGDGGGGGGFSIVGFSGSSCTGGVNNPGAGGTIVPSGDFNLNNIFRGGFGGGAGGDSSAGVYGTGAGGGGAIHILAGGDITITATGSITSKGGNGGVGGADGGGGGAGSGGVIWIQTLEQLILNGSLDALGGTGGAAAAGAAGGDGGRGLIRLEDLDGIISGSGSVPGYANVLSVIPGRTLKSSISCGSVDQSNENRTSNFMQIVAGFMFIFGASFLFKQNSKLFS